jgi:flagellar basal-body rod modification protein FlgD
MSSINGIGSPFGEQTSTQAASSNQNSSSMQVNKTEFLKLLVTQLQNQDPMNPINNEQFLTQLASFSSLEQLMSINDAVTKLAGPSAKTEST